VLLVSVEAPVTTAVPLTTFGYRLIITDWSPSYGAFAHIARFAMNRHALETNSL
jgi:hypothetical protein